MQKENKESIGYQYSIEKGFDILNSNQKGGPGSGSWDGPGDPRFAHDGDDDAMQREGFSQSVRKLRNGLSDKDISYELEAAKNGSLRGMDVSKSSMSIDEIAISSVVASVYMGKGYQTMNGYLRTGTVPKKFTRFVSEDTVAAQAKVMENLVRNVLPKSDQDVVWRGVETNKAFMQQTWQEMIKPGTIFEDKGFVSSSSKREVAEAFGAHKMCISGAKKHGTDLSPIVSMGSESEIVFPPGTRFKTDRYDKEDDTLYVTAIGVLGSGKKMFIPIEIEGTDDDVRFFDNGFVIVSNKK